MQQPTPVFKISKSRTRSMPNGVIIEQENLVVEGPDISVVSEEFDKRWEDGN